MAKISLHRGEKDTAKSMPLKDGQVIIGTINNERMALYHDVINEQGELVRVELDISDYIKQLEKLEKVVEELEDSVIIVNRLVPNPEKLDVIAIQTNDKLNILTNNSDRIIYIDSIKDDNENMTDTTTDNVVHDTVDNINTNE